MSATWDRVHTGLWTNWDEGKVNGSVITLKTQQGFYLTAFLAIWITWTGGHLWSIICYTAMQLYSTRQPRDSLHHQRQALLRNTGMPGEAFWSFTKVLWAWRRYSTVKPKKRVFPILVIAGLHMAAFTVAGIFASRITQTGGEVLLVAGECGWLSRDALGSLEFTLLRASAQQSLTYARTCYSDSSSDDAEGADRNCHQFSRRTLGAQSHHEGAECPFNASMCKNSTAVQFDTGFISSDHLGINSPSSQRLWFRKVVTWTPINLNGRVGPLVPSSNSTTEMEGTQAFYLGGVDTGNGLLNYTFNLSVTYNEADVRPYTIRPFSAYANNANASTFQPIPELNRTDADVTILQISNHVVYAEPNNDPVYQTFNYSSTGDGWYEPTVRIAVLGATEQYQLCTSPSASSCSPLGGAFNQNWDSLHLTPEQLGLAKHILQTSRESNLFRIAYYLGAEGFTAPDFLVSSVEIQSAKLPNNQWQADVENMHNISLSSMQRLTVQWASQSLAPRLGNIIAILDKNTSIERPQDEITARLCKQQKIRTYKYSSFSALGVGLIFGLGGLIMIINCCLTDIVKYVRKKKDRNMEKSKEWDEAAVLHLQMMALERRYGEEWIGSDQAVPIPLHPEHKWSQVADRKSRSNTDSSVGRASYSPLSKEDELP